MTYTLTEHTNHRIEITGNLASDVVDRERETIIRSIRGRARLPGFRDGKAPASLIRARFADDIDSELKEHLSQIVWREVMTEEENLRPLTMPQIRDAGFDDDGGFRFVAELEVRPSYELPELAAAELPEVSLEVSDAEIDEELETLREQQAVWEPTEDEQATDGMLVEADLVGRMDGSDEDPYEETDARFIVGSDGVPPEVNEALQGAKVGDDLVATKVFPEDDENSERAGRSVTYSITVKGLKRKALPEVDDELAKGLGLDSLDELTDRVREALVRRKKTERREQWRRALLDHLEADIDINDMPSSLVQNAINERLNRFAYEMAMQGADLDGGDFNWEELAAKAEPAARRHVADNLILEQLAGEWEIAVPESEVDAYIAAEASQLQIPPAEHKANLAAEDKLDHIRHAARLTAVVDEMITRAGGEAD